MSIMPHNFILMKPNLLAFPEGGAPKLKLFIGQYPNSKQLSYSIQVPEKMVLSFSNWVALQL